MERSHPNQMARRTRAILEDIQVTEIEQKVGYRVDQRTNLNGMGLVAAPNKAQHKSEESRKNPRRGSE